MNKATSLYLDLVRFTAALVVFFGHICGSRFTGGLFWQAGPYADEAVDVFFVLSGFVIAYVAENRECTPRAYWVARCARVYSVAFPALIATFALDAIGRTIRPDLYSASWGYVTDGQITQFITSLLFINRLWYLHITQGSDVSYWSLSYEVWYYITFACLIFSPNKWKVPAAALALLIAGPNVAALFPLWFIGVITYRATRGRSVPTVAAIMFFGSIAFWIGYEVYAWHWKARLDHLPFQRAQIAQDYLIGILFATHLFGFSQIGGRFDRLLLILENPIKWVAGATFTLYLFHVPIAQLLTTVVPWEPHSWITRAIMFGGTLTLIFVIAEFTERRKMLWRRIFMRVFNAIPARQVVSAGS